jgi:signal transduction histidine kinase
LLRYEDDGTASVVATWGIGRDALPAGARLSVEGEHVAGVVWRTGRPVRMDEYDCATGTIEAHLPSAGKRSLMGTPITVDGRLWGVMIVVQGVGERLPAETGPRVAKFTGLLATAIAGLQARAELAASRARIVAATDEERRRVVRDLHDGAQQRLVHTVVTLKLARRALVGSPEARAAELVAEALEQAERAIAELRDLAHGIVPPVLTRGGVTSGIRALAARMPIPVEVWVDVDRMSPAIEATAYLVVAEALTNVTKHAAASSASVRAWIAEDTLYLEISDDGTGGANPSGTGLVGLADRLAVLDGRLRVTTEAGGGTLVMAEMPVAEE